MGLEKLTSANEFRSREWVVLGARNVRVPLKKDFTKDWDASGCWDSPFTGTKAYFVDPSGRFVLNGNGELEFYHEVTYYG